MFEERGFAETAVRDIAEAVGATERTFFRCSAVLNALFDLAAVRGTGVTVLFTGVPGQVFSHPGQVRAAGAARP